MQAYYRGLKAISALLCRLSYHNLHRLASWLGPVYRLVGRKQRLRAIRHVRLAYRISEQEAEVLVAQMFKNIACNALETFYMPRLTKEFLQEHVEVRGLEHIDAALAEGKGVIVLTAHVGNWEWMGAALAGLGYPTTTIVKNQPSAQFTRFLNEYRTMVGLEVFARDGADLIRAAKAMKQRKILGFLADQDGGPQGLPVPFLGEMSSAPLGPATFARRFQAPVLPIFTRRKENGDHLVEISPPFYYEDTGVPEVDLYRLTERCVRITEDFINAYPTEWLWFQYRWKTRPEEIEDFERKRSYAAEAHAAEKGGDDA